MKPTVMMAAALFAALTLGSAARAASFDGKWQATGPAQSIQCPGINIQFEVKGNGFASSIGTAKFTYRFRGRIEPDGTFDTKSPGGTAHIAGQFAGDVVMVKFDNDQCQTPREAKGGRTG